MTKDKEKRLSSESEIESMRSEYDFTHAIPGLTTRRYAKGRNVGLRIFVASPMDCRRERDTIRRLVRSDPTIQTVARELNVVCEVCGWEDVCPAGGRPQEIINAAIKKFDPDWFIFVFWHRLGGEAGEGITGTEEEWRLAQELSQQRSKEVAVSIYFNKASVPPHDINGHQIEALKRFREDIFQNFLALAKDFNGTREFEDQFRAHLSEKLINRSPKFVHGIEFIPDHLLNVSAGLLKWPTTVGSEKHIERPQLKMILQRIEESESSATIILGPPGSGKSAFLARLANVLKERETLMLAIKADQLGSDIETPEDLRHSLGLPIGLQETILTLSTKHMVVLLIDQLDAVSELLDRKSGRLNVLLNLVQSLAGRRNVHILASSREFEFRHDVRLSKIDCERLDLEPPTWEQISDILSQSGLKPTTIGEPLRNLLLVPLNLKVFLDIGIASAPFESHYALLEELWKRRVVSAEGVEGREALLESLADTMSTEETLWLPSAVTDIHPAARQSLEQADILTRAQNGLTIGFRHQAYYDFTIARAFGRGARSLSNDVLTRQDGLFVRPSLISGLHYLRATARSEYHKQLSLLMGSQLRLHLRSLIIEILGEQSEPDDFETNLIIPLLDSEDEGPRVLRSLATSMGWFARVKRNETFLKWLSKPPDKAAHCVPLLSAAMSHYPEVCSQLVERFWIENDAYDSLSLAVLQERKDWDNYGVGLVCRIARRTQLPWFVEALAERAADSAPAEAPFIIRADFERRLEKALKELEQSRPELPPDADRQQRLMHELTYERSRPLRQLIEDSQTWDNLEEFAVRAPKAFLDQLWPWFLNVVTRMAGDEHEFAVGYRHDPTSYRSFEGDLQPAPVVSALLTAVIKLAAKDTEGFLEFLRQNISSDLLIVHRLLSRGLEELAAEDPKTGLEYLSSDLRRLALGDMHDPSVETKRLIRAVSRHLDEKGIQQLEKVIAGFSGYKRILPEWSAKERFERRQWDRQKRLRLLRAIPVERLSLDSKRLRSEEELVFHEPHGSEETETRGLVGVVGSRMTVKEMARASDEDLLRLFDELPDSAGWDNPKRPWSRDRSRAGGAIQLSREFGELAKQAPDRVFALTSSLQPGIHEQYAGEAVRGLVSTDLPATVIIGLIEELDNRGFHSSEFRDDISFAVEALATCNKGLPDTFLQRLIKWLAEEPEPVPSESQIVEGGNHKYEGTNSILYGYGISSSLTHGRGSITRAIAEGYLKRDPADIQRWGKFIESRLANEKNPKLWSEILIRMPVLFQENRHYATLLFDKVIKACPAVLNYPFALHAIAHVLRGLDPKEVGESWLESLVTNGSSFCQQAYGELLPLFNCLHHDAGSMDRLMAALEGDRSPYVDLGLAYAATHLWTSKLGREVATRILAVLAGSDNEAVQRAVASLFRITQDYFELDSDMRVIIDKVTSNPPVLLLAAEDLIGALEDLTAIEPNLVSRICGEILKFGREQIDKPGTSWINVAATLTNIALTLHRQTVYRQNGLQLFEQLIALNVREARDAIELLDRRRQRRPRWRRKVRRNRRAS